MTKLDINEIENYNKYPIHIKKDFGEELVKKFKEKETGKVSKKNYEYSLNGYKYLLCKEILYDEDDHFIELKKIIDVNFYLDREKL